MLLFLFQTYAKHIGLVFLILTLKLFVTLIFLGGTVFTVSWVKNVLKRLTFLQVVFGLGDKDHELCLLFILSTSLIYI